MEAIERSFKQMLLLKLENLIGHITSKKTEHKQQQEQKSWKFLL